MSRATSGDEIWGWNAGQTGCEARRPRAWRGAGVRLLFLFLLLSAVAGPVRAESFAAGSRAYAAQNYVRAAEIFLPLAEQRDARAQTYLGVMYLRGQGVPQNFAVAAYWLHLASAAGVPTAQYFFGMMYDKGQGMPQDFVLAEAWLNLAVAHAEPQFRSRWVLIRDAIASKMSEAQLAESRRLAYEWRPEPYLALNWRLDTTW
ncbi:Sel1 repeat-containing protein [Roseiarcus fermentans]|uniref:Sel1 repeat-containing protein n=1 Tax=Roseiarcus fermentans TaxID=1473586 RepID=A0A366ESJ5_9HYPH|nr:Sel1 repeat-containing protein [Roseiarcus fermentans]